MKRYKTLKEQKCEACNKENCECQECTEMCETCPDNSYPSGGGCKSKHSGSTLSGHCDKGHHWDPTSRRCISLTK